MEAHEAERDLRGMYEAAIAAADPARVVRDGLAAREVALELGRDRPHWIIALGKAAPAMARAAVAHCEHAGLTISGGLVVSPVDPAETVPGLECVSGDHPVPGLRSAHAAERLGALTERIARDDVVVLLVSGGTSSLIGAPIDGVRAEDLATLNALLLGAGVPIGRINAVRKRFSRWGAGRLAVALDCARVIPVLLADVPTEDPAMIGSGPVTPDPLEARQVERILRDAGLAVRVPLSIGSAIGAMRAGAAPETPKAGDRAFAKIEEPYVVGISSALEAVAAHAATLGYSPVLLSRTLLTGDATAAGRVIAHSVARAPEGSCLVWGGETTVRLPDDHGLGGRCQQLALAAAEVFNDLETLDAWLLAAGTDGQDGPAPAAGAVINGDTWWASDAEDGHPAEALRRCDAYPVLARADAILPPRVTGTNVMDLVVAVRA